MRFHLSKELLTENQINDLKNEAKQLDYELLAINDTIKTLDQTVNELFNEKRLNEEAIRSLSLETPHSTKGSPLSRKRSLPTSGFRTAQANTKSTQTEIDSKSKETQPKDNR